LFFPNNYQTTLLLPLYIYNEILKIEKQINLVKKKEKLSVSPFFLLHDS
jgi:hypothetical protein